MKTKSTTGDVKIEGAVAGKLVNASVQHALEAYPDADQLIINIARKYADRVLLQ